MTSYVIPSHRLILLFLIICQIEWNCLHVNLFKCLLFSSNVLTSFNSSFPRFVNLIWLDFRALYLVNQMFHFIRSYIRILTPENSVVIVHFKSIGLTAELFRFEYTQVLSCCFFTDVCLLDKLKRITISSYHILPYNKCNGYLFIIVSLFLYSLSNFGLFLFSTPRNWFGFISLLNVIRTAGHVTLSSR